MFAGHRLLQLYSHHQSSATPVLTDMSLDPSAGALLVMALRCTEGGKWDTALAAANMAAEAQLSKAAAVVSQLDL